MYLVQMKDFPLFLLKRFHSTNDDGNAQVNPNVE